MVAASRPDAPEVADYLGVLRRRWWVVLLAVVVCGAVAAGDAKVAPKSYAASVLIQVTALPTNANAVDGHGTGKVSMDNEAQIAASDQVAVIAAKALHSTTPPEKLAQKLTIS